jgi:hypothetical protein
VTVRLFGHAFDRLHLSFAVAGRAASGPLGLGVVTGAPASPAGAAPVEIPADASTQTGSVDPRRPAHADALRLAVHLRAAMTGATGQSLLLCGLLPAQSARRLALETALAFVQLQHVPVLVVDLEPLDGPDGDVPELLAETDAAAWVAPGTRRPVAAVLRVFRGRTINRRGYLTSAEFGQDLAAWRTGAGVVLCCAQSLADSVDTLAVATQCTGTVLVVPAKGATVEPVLSARETFTRAGVSLLGCVFDSTPVERARRKGAGA